MSDTMKYTEVWLSTARKRFAASMAQEVKELPEDLAREFLSYAIAELQVLQGDVMFRDEPDCEVQLIDELDSDGTAVHEPLASEFSKLEIK